METAHRQCCFWQTEQQFCSKEAVFYSKSSFLSGCVFIFSLHLSSCFTCIFSAYSTTAYQKNPEKPSLDTKFFSKQGFSCSTESWKKFCHQWSEFIRQSHQKYLIYLEPQLSLPEWGGLTQKITFSLCPAQQIPDSF